MKLKCKVQAKGNESITLGVVLNLVPVGAEFPTYTGHVSGFCRWPGRSLQLSAAYCGF